MSQAHGRYSGSRDNGQRQARHVKKTQSNRQVQAYVKGPPARDPAQTASIFKTRSFQLLVDAVGAENIALGLDSNLTRVAELIKGERFTPETAFHMETTLGLPHGFFDQPNPVLAPETIARLKSPLDFVQPDDEPEVVSEIYKPASAATVSQQPLFEDRLPEEPEMPKKVTGGSPTVVQKRNAAVQPGARNPLKDATANVESSPKASPQQSLALNGSAAVQNIRRTNLHVLTTRKGSKVTLGVVMGLTGSNMAHRLYGKKRMDDAEANRFTERLGLPTGWLDTPRSEAEIPESVSRLLLPTSRGRASDVEQRASTRADESPPDSAGVPHEEEATVVSHQDHASDPIAELASRSVRESDASLPATLGQNPGAAALQLHPMQRTFTSVTSLENLDGIEPIAEALIKTLAGKARIGRLDQLKALELLQQAVSL
ncbi:hypothetical protein AWB68_08076 [Caballeronia choica]|jgi:hypothetical protein|uniref:Uncharacterized protein n=1 Tax=Caballeronia choica TaxID=326476 RepID=A0A158L1P2_9BURK|nr:hypothetical protein [Caballeronia choica]SAL86571.1 hypothetical protein AWB68_08076 [Caballeronia choica]